MENFVSIPLLAMALTLAAMFSFSSSAHHEQNRPISDPRQPSYSILEQSMNRFNHSYARSYSSLVLDVKRGQLIVAARDYLFRLSLVNLSLLEETHWPADDNGVRLCQDKGQSKDDCRNYIRVLHVHGERVLACGTYAFSPKCSWRSIEGIGVGLDWMSGVASCPYSPHSHISSLLSSGLEGTADLFIGSPTDFSGQDNAIYRLPLLTPLSTSAGSSPPTLRHNRGRLRTMQYNAKWLNVPEFVGSVEVDHFVYFFFREVAVEFSNCGKTVYSRVARVCKNDLGGGQSMLKETWTTFLKARLNCSLPAEYPFYYDHIQSVTYLEEERLFYATFTTSENSIAGSAVCSFTLDSIQESFAGPFKYQSSPTSTWESVHSTHAQSHCNSNGSSSSALEAEKYQLMDRAVQSNKGPIVRLDSQRLSHIAVDVVAIFRHVLYVASRDGFIRKYSVSTSSQAAYLVEILYPFADSSQLADNHIKTMQFLKQQNALYIGTENEVIRLPVQRCKRFITKTQCYNSKDPYCSWLSELEKCSSASSFQDPQASYLEPSITSRPTFSTPENDEKEGSSIVRVEGVCRCNESLIIAKLSEKFKQDPPSPPTDEPSTAGSPEAQGRTGLTGPKGSTGEKEELGGFGPVGKESPSGPKGEPSSDGTYNPGQPETNGINGVDAKDEEPGSVSQIGAQGPVEISGPIWPFSSVGKVKRKQGERSKRNKPGKTCDPKPQTESCNRGSSSQGDEESQKVRLPAATIVTNMEALLKSSDIHPVGTIAYLDEEESLLVRVRKGWRNISMGNFVPLLTPITTLKPSMPIAFDKVLPRITKFPSLRLVALNEPFSGDMGGIHRVDHACFRQARQAGLRGTFRAFLASHVQKLDSIVRPAYREYPVVNLRGEVLFRTWNDLFYDGRAGEFTSARKQLQDIYSFNNRNVFDDPIWSQKMVWHGAGPSGERQLNSYCDAWTSRNSKTLGVATSLIGSPPSHQQQSSNSGKLLAQDKFSCQNRFVVLCIEAKVSPQKAE